MLKTKNVVIISIVFIILIITLFPVFWIMITSFKLKEQIVVKTPLFIFKPVIDNYIEVFIDPTFNLGIRLRNSLIVAGISSIIGTILGALAAYALSRFIIKGAENLKFWMLSYRFIPPIAIAIPLFVFFKRLRLLANVQGQLFSLILIHTVFSAPFAVWLLEGFFNDLPRALDESALIDGCTRFQALFRIIFPVALPAIAVTLMFTFLLSWNEFIIALVFTSGESTTVPVGFGTYITNYRVFWGEMGAASTIILIPLFIIIWRLQKYIVRGLTLGAVKG